MKRVLLFFFLLAGLQPSVRAAESESMPDRTLRQLVTRQRELFAEAGKGGPDFDQDNFQRQVQELTQGYELLLRDNPKYAPGYAMYGYMLGKVGMKRESIAALLKANELDPDVPLVKNQIGNFLAEEGRPLEALPYFMAAIKLEPKEPLYHYVLGQLLYEARDDFIKSGEWTAAALDHAWHEAFRRAAELAPDRADYAVRYAQSFADLTPPDWDGGLKAWAALEEKASTPVERQFMRLQAANILIKQGKNDHARLLLDTITETSLQGQKQKLVALLPANTEK